jgi:chloramphenicol-sensitive protein RarD
MDEPASAGSRRSASGVAFAAAAYLIWGLFPVYFRLLRGVPAPEILAHRIVWSAAFLVLLVTILGRWGEALRQLRVRGTLPALAASAIFISGNWLTYIWAVNSGHVLEASLGYFVNPLVTVLLGVAFLRESLTRGQRIAVGLATGGVLWLVVRSGQVPWIALGLAMTFALYGLVRKRLRVDATSGLLAEVCLLAPAALLYLAVFRGEAHFGATPRFTALLASAGVVTAVPLLLFAAAVQRLRLSTVGLLQYLNPTMQFAIAVFVFHEPFGKDHAAAFACIWASLAIYTYEAITSQRRA